MGKVVTSDCLSSFKGRRVFVTGHTGFKGSWLTFLLNEIGAEVLGYALPPVGKKNHFELLELAETISHVEADIRDGEKLIAVMNKFQPEFVFHLAAQALVRPSYSDPKSTFETNVQRDAKRFGYCLFTPGTYCRTGLRAFYEIVHWE